MIRDRFLLIGFFAAQFLSGMHLSFGVEIAVPSSEEMIRASDVIVVGRFEAVGTFKVDQSLKGPFSIGSSIQVLSPFPEMSFPFAKYRAELNEAQTILVGRWDRDRAVVTTIYGASSLWPQGSPKERLPFSTIADLIPYIQTELQKATGMGTSPSEKVPSPSVRTQASAILSPTAGRDSSIAEGPPASPEASRVPILDQRTTLPLPESRLGNLLWVVVTALGVTVVAVWLIARNRR